MSQNIDELKSVHIEKKYMLKYRVPGVFVICACLGAAIVFGASFITMTFSSLNHNGRIATEYINFLAPSLNSVIATGDQAAIEKKFGDLKFLEGIAYIALTGANDAVLTDWQAAEATLNFNAKVVAGIQADSVTRRGRAFYLKIPLDNKESHAVIIGIDVAKMMSDQFSKFGIFYFLFFCGAALFFVAALYETNKHMTSPTTHICDYSADILLNNDLTRVHPIEVETEIGQMTFVINTITEKMRTMLLALKETCIKFEEVVKELGASGNNISHDSVTIKQSVAGANKKMDELNRSFFEVTAKLQELASQSERGSTTVYEMSQVNQEVFDNVNAMSTSVSQSIKAIGEMTGAIEKTASHVEQLNNDIDSVNSSMQRLDSSIAQEEKSARDSIEISKELAQNAESGMKALQETINGIGKIQKSSAETANVIATLGEHAMNIGNILHVIDDVTKQTNLLALNAAIISAQAGEHGRGFAVVADEIGALAGRTKDSTKEIAELISTIQSETQRAVKVMEESQSIIEEGAKLGVEAAKAFDKLKESADKSTIQAKALAAATMEQAGDVRAVTKAIESITGTVEEINSSAHAQAEEAAALNSAAGKMNLLNQQVAKSSEEQARSAKDVLKAIQNISEMSAIVNKRQEAQTASTKRAVSLINSVDTYAKAQEESSQHLTSVIEEINQHIGKLAGYASEFKI